MDPMVRWRLGGAAYIRIYMASPLSVHCPISWLNMFSFRALIDAEHEHDPHLGSGSNAGFIVGTLWQS